jgi:hypothetical protein
MIGVSGQEENDYECYDPQDSRWNAHTETAALSHPSIFPREPIRRPGNRAGCGPRSPALRPAKTGALIHDGRESEAVQLVETRIALAPVRAST